MWAKMANFLHRIPHTCAMYAIVNLPESRKNWRYRRTSCSLPHPAESGESWTHTRDLFGNDIVRWPT